MWSKSSTLLSSLLLFSLQNSLPPVSVQEFASRREAVAKEVQDGVFYLEGAKEAELENRYLQDDDFFYLTGIETQDSSLLLVAEKGKLVEEVLFLPAKNKNWEQWNGVRLAPGEEAEKATGAKKTHVNSKRKEIVGKALQGAKRVFAAAEKKKGEKSEPKSPLLQELLDTKNSHLQDIRPLLDSLQVRKSPAEVARIERAIRITEKGFESAAPLLRPENYEYHLMGAVEGSFLGQGANGFAFPSIVGSGPNSCRLHYQQNQRQMQEGELVVMDIGAKFEHYCADVTRTLPVSGKFSTRQAEIYNLVLEAQKKAMEAAKPGVKVSDVHMAAWKFLNEKKHDKDFWHGTSHFVGLKVHDTPTSYGEELKPGMIITVEPGIYLPDENLGVRIEDDILITENGCRHLSNGIPREIPELEAWIQKLQTAKQ